MIVAPNVSTPFSLFASSRVCLIIWGGQALSLALPGCSSTAPLASSVITTL